jgi:cytochrome P450
LYIMPTVDHLLPFEPDSRGFHDPAIGYASGSEAVCPMRLPATGEEVLVLREHEAVMMALADRRFSLARVDPRYVTIGSTYRSPEDLPKLDPPETTTIRRPLGVVFSERNVERQRSALELVTRELVNRLAATPQPADLVKDYCLPFIAEAVSSSIGIPATEWPHILDLAGRGLGIVEDASEAADRTMAWEELYEYCERLVDDKKARSDGRMLSSIVAVLDRAGLSREKVLHTVATVVVGLPTPTGVLQVVALELFRRPETVDACLAQPELWSATINELMRYRANFALALPRVALEDVRINDECTVRKGQVVVPSLLAAAHDPGRTQRPEEFDVHQTAARSIVFGAGAHFCPGASLGRQWLEVGLHGLFAGLPRIRLAVAEEELHWQNGTLSVPKEIPVSWA